MSLFEFTYWDTHKRPALNEDGELIWEQVEDPGDETPWKTFKFSLETDQVKVDYFYETVIFQRDMPIRCTRVVLSDGNSVFAKLQHDTFKRDYEEHMKGATTRE